MRNANKYLKVCNKVSSVLNSFTRVFNGVYIDKVAVNVEDEDNDYAEYKVSFDLEVDATRTDSFWESGKQILVEVEGEYDDIYREIYESIANQTHSLDNIQTGMLKESLKRILSIKLDNT